MRIILVTPAASGSRFGNRVTATRWARVLRSLDHRAAVRTHWDGERADALIALHAWRSAVSIERFRARFPTRPLVVALTGTDIYGFLETDPDATRRSLAAADALVALHEGAGEALPAAERGKLRVIRQAAPERQIRRSPSKRTLDVCVVGHLRAEKDPLRCALAARGLPVESRLRILHAGGARDAAWAGEAQREMASNPRYRWLGELSPWRVRRLYERSHAMVISSVTEGGANVVSEALGARLPVIASWIPGNVGLLGDDYPGYFPPQNTDALRDCLHKAESDPGFLAELARAGAARLPLFSPEREREAWRHLLDELD